MKFTLTIYTDTYLGTFDFDTIDAFVSWANMYGHSYTSQRIADRLSKEGGEIYLGYGTHLKENN